MNSSLKRRALMGVGTVFAALGVIAYSASSAMADTEYYSETNATYVEFWPDGDGFRVHDNAPDGASAAVQYRLAKEEDPNRYYSTKTLVSSAGYGKSTGFVRNFPENRELDFRACSYKGGKAYACTSWTWANTSNI
ncbi:hypothetical protein OHU45_17740 [Streptomyces tubercidicus]|uniref:hypothetical protein n=1 Tax=Streptomyces tubercidicus TaxID=47759 RepID=UPI002E0E6966|nr:hypothetical protein OG761_17535 [Streptomyces tubercidicus]WSX21805.1 hypothetical protein OG690_19550 [Streptomyces tubercidicus]